MHSGVCQKGCSGVFIQPEMLYHFRYRGERASGQRVFVILFLLLVCLRYIKIKSFNATKKKKRICLQCERPGFDCWVGKIPLKKGTATHSSILAWIVRIGSIFQYQSGR